MTNLAEASQPGRSGEDTQARRAGRALRAAWVWPQRALLGVALTLLLAIGVLPYLGLYRPVTVLSSSMKPTFSPGDMIIDVPERVSAVRVGQVISYRVPVGQRWVESHRIVKVLQGGAHPVVQTKGDANSGVDPWTARLQGNTAWREVAAIPKLGYLVNALRGESLHLAAVVIAPLLLAAIVLSEMWGLSGRARRQSRRRPIAEPVSHVLQKPHPIRRGER